MTRQQQLEEALSLFVEPVVESSDWGEWCHYCNGDGGNYHEDTCPTQIARRLLDMPPLKGKEQWEMEEAERKEKARERNRKWREENPDQAAEHDKTMLMWLSMSAPMSQDGLLFRQIANAEVVDRNDTRYSWVEEE